MIVLQCFKCKSLDLKLDVEYGILCSECGFVGRADNFVLYEVLDDKNYLMNIG